jgi:signal transduction histidine kinase
LDAADALTRHQLRAALGWSDVGIGAASSIISTIGVWQEILHASRPEPPALYGYLFGAVAGIPIVFRRRHPLLVASSSVGIVAAYHFSGFSGAAPAMATIVAVYCLAAEPGPPFTPIAAGGLGLLAAGVVTLPPSSVSPSDGAVYGPAFLFAMVAFVGDATRRRLDAMAQRVSQLDAERVAEVSRRITEERIEMARELHDVVAHTVAVIAVQASVAEDALDLRPHDAKAALRIIRQSAREATQELRSTLHILRSAHNSDNGHSPTPSLENLAELLRRLPSLQIAVRTEGHRRALPKAIDLVAYRIVQEALTNVVRHSSCSEATVTFTYQIDALVVEIADEGTGPPPGESEGFGLIGMRERVHALNGSLIAGPGPTGGYRVSATLPELELP